MFQAGYFSPTYFATTYFAPTVNPTEKGPGEVDLSYHDRDAYEAILAALEDSEFLATVLFGEEADAAGLVGTGQLPLVIVTPGHWQEVEHVDPLAATRYVNYTLTIIVQGSDPLERFREADRLGWLLQNQLDGSDLGGGCLAALTRLRKGGPEPTHGATELRYKLFGSFSYVIPDITQRTVSC